MTKYEEDATITLTVSECLSLLIALDDAVANNVEHHFPSHAKEQIALRAKIRPQVIERINEAAAEVGARLNTVAS